MNVASKYLSDLQAGRETVNIFLKSGIKLIGEIKDFDNEAILLSHGIASQLIFRSAISTVQPKNA